MICCQVGMKTEWAENEAEESAVVQTQISDLTWDSIQVLKAKRLYPYLCESKIAGVQNAMKRSRDDCEGVPKMITYFS